MMEELFLQDGKMCVRKNELLPERDTILFIHGVSGNLGAWAPYEDSFCHTHNVLFYDIRGHGKSHRYPNEQDYSLSFFADDLEYLISFFKLQKVILVAHSFGTLIALDYLRTHGQNAPVIRALILSPRLRQEATLVPILLRIAIGALKVVQLFYSPRPRCGHTDYRGFGSGDFDLWRMIDDLRNTGLLYYLYCIHRVSSVQLEDEVAHMKTPLLWVHGEKDTISPIKYARSLHDRVPTLNFKVLPHVNHVFVLSDVAMTTDIIDHFVNRTGDNDR